MAKKTKKKKQRYTELSALKGLIRQQATSYRRLAEGLGLSAHSLSDKINGYYCFDATEIEQIAIILEISADDIAKYFFPSILKISA